MKKNIKEYVARCLKCQVSKSKKMKSPGLLQPLTGPNLKFESVGVDFIAGLPKT